MIVVNFISAGSSGTTGLRVHHSLLVSPVFPVFPVYEREIQEWTGKTVETVKTWVDSGVDPSNPIQVMLAWGPQP